ncbi:MAG: discoidin domain-containing protein [Planctomycetales bacterium]|nr:discoidin domain-containing protein [Planctomycetales bacterium]
MNYSSVRLCLLLAFACVSPLFAQQQGALKPIRALLIAGGCCHDYAQQQEAISKGIQARANVQVDVYWTDNTTTRPVLPLYRKLNWAKHYDVIIHDECAADIKDEALLNRIVQVHQELPAVHLHCAMHSFRTGSDAWFKHLGLQSSGHGPQVPIEIKFEQNGHPITKTLEDWTTIREELYNNVKLFGAEPLATGKQIIGRQNPRVEEAIVAWVNESAGARSFSTTIGHNTETVKDPRYLDLITRGLLWACDKLNDDYLKPYEGDNATTFIDKTKYDSASTESLGERPANSTLVALKASSTQQGHPAHHAIDGKNDTRWCANGGQYPQSLELQFEKPVSVDGIQIDWETRRAYQYRIEGSIDGESWTELADQTQARDPHPEVHKLNEATSVKHIRITGVRGPAGGWCSIREVRVTGPELGQLWPAKIDANSGAFVAAQDAASRYEERGNTVPRIEKLTPEQETEILREVQVPDGFEATVFASPPAVNYPVFVASSVDGTVFVSSDGNGSLGRQEERGRVIRLRDLDGDGRADETKVFCEVDAPRGLVWDHDRLYLMHPPNLSVFIDKNGDGVADVQKTLVKNLAFGYDKRPADHTTNGLSLGVDGWLYIAGGDFGFMNAEGTDGTVLTHRGGGVIRVRPDGSGLEVYSTGTRNILEVAISPQMEMFARDNTNDGGGWDVRLHHFTGNDDHGYPRLYKNFNDECVQPLADYGGGSGCGAVYIDEPGFGEWNNAPFTADWGTGALYFHTVRPTGATYQETSKPRPFIQLPRPTDADVDGNSRVYCASWKGAQFNWAGENVGYIVSVRPREFTPAAMPDFENASDDELVALLDDPSYRRRMEAQRTLMRRGNSASDRLLEAGLAKRSPERRLLERIQDHTNSDSTSLCLQSLSHADPVVVHTASRSLAKRQAVTECIAAFGAKTAPTLPLMRVLAMMHSSEAVDALVQRLSKASTEDQTEILSALCRLYHQEGQWRGDSWGTRPDTRGPYYQPETWAKSEQIATVLQNALDDSSPQVQAALLETMRKNRIELAGSLERVLELAAQDKQLIPAAVAQLSRGQDLPAGTTEILTQAIDGDFPETVVSDVVLCLGKMDSEPSARLLVKAMTTLEKSADRGTLRMARRLFSTAASLNNQIRTYAEIASSTGAERTWGEAALLVVASNQNASPEAREVAQSELDQIWRDETRRRPLMEMASRLRSHALDQKILTARKDSNSDIANAAAQAIRMLRIEAPQADNTPKIDSLQVSEAFELIVKAKGDVELGRQVFEKASCTKCHSLTKDEVQKGPFLGSIARTYKRPALAEAVLQPSKSIAQGFKTNQFVTVDGKVFSGFVTDEQAAQVTIRDNQGNAITILKSDIEERSTSIVSVMPEGLLKNFTVNEAASLIEFLESLSAAEETE